MMEQSGKPYLIQHLTIGNDYVRSNNDPKV